MGAEGTDGSCLGGLGTRALDSGKVIDLKDCGGLHHRVLEDEAPAHLPAQAHSPVAVPDLTDGLLGGQKLGQASRRHALEHHDALVRLADRAHEHLEHRADPLGALG